MLVSLPLQKRVNAKPTPHPPYLLETHKHKLSLVVPFQEDKGSELYHTLLAELHTKNDNVHQVEGVKQKLPTIL